MKPIRSKAISNSVGISNAIAISISNWPVIGFCDSISIKQKAVAVSPCDSVSVKQ